ncbi:MAG: hypothetical protein WCB18_04555, partial [Thermoplasmata archaeon]
LGGPDHRRQFEKDEEAFVGMYFDLKQIYPDPQSAVIVYRGVPFIVGGSHADSEQVYRFIREKYGVPPMAMPPVYSLHSRPEGVPRMGPRRLARP